MPKCIEQDCSVILISKPGHVASPRCRKCREARKAKLGYVATEQFDTAEKIDAEVQRLTDLRATHLGFIAALEERKAQLPVLVDPQELGRLRDAAAKIDLLTHSLAAYHGTAFRPDAERSELAGRFISFLQGHPNLLRGFRI